jgi:hypothetical protein
MPKTPLSPCNVIALPLGQWVCQLTRSNLSPSETVWLGASPRSVATAFGVAAHTLLESQCPLRPFAFFCVLGLEMEIAMQGCSRLSARFRKFVGSLSPARVDCEIRASGVRVRYEKARIDLSDPRAGF